MTQKWKFYLSACKILCGGKCMLHPKNIIHTVKNGGRSMMLWVCFSSPRTEKQVIGGMKIDEAKHRLNLKYKLQRF